MKKLIPIILILSVHFAWASGPDDMILWRYEAPLVSAGQFGLATGQIVKSGPGGIFLYSNPYRVKSLGWNYGAFKYGFGQWGIMAGFRSYALSDLYDDHTTSLVLALKPFGSSGLSVGVNYGYLKFGAINSYDRFDIDAGFSYSYKKMAAELELDRITLKKPYDYPERPEPQVIGSIELGDGMIFSAGFKEFYTRQSRWFFQQNINIVRGADLELGYLSNPNILQWGLDLSWKSVRLSFAYQGIGKLNDTMVMGLSWGN